MASTSDTQPYDNSIKTIFNNDAANILPHLIPGVVWQETLDIEILHAPMRIDRAFLVLRKGKRRIVHMEFQASTDPDMARRLLRYHVNIWNDHQCPVISIILYLFKSSVPESPLIEYDEDEDEDILVFRFRVITLWTEDMHYYTENHVVSLYPLLPAMRFTEVGILLDAIEEMVEYYKEDETFLAQQLLWFRTFLERTDTIPMEEKKKVEERLDIFDQLLEQSQYVSKQRARAKKEGFAEGKAEGKAEGRAEGKAEGRAEGKAEGRAEGKAEGEVKTLQRTLVNFVKVRYPSLTELAQERVTRTPQAHVLDALVNWLITNPDEEAVRFILSGTSTPPAQH